MWIGHWFQLFASIRIICILRLNLRKSIDKCQNLPLPIVEISHNIPEGFEYESIPSISFGETLYLMIAL